jgi:phosphoribosylformimino-5-aminoimidazole carboxamide ribotide isomerase
MIVIPALSLREGASVRLVGGSYTEEKVRLDDPLEAARSFARHGFSALHLVDLDAATGRGENSAVIREILHASEVPVMVAGGVRTAAQVERLLDASAARVVVGTRALEDRHWLQEVAEEFPGQLVVAADVRKRTVVAHGWSRSLHRHVERVVEELAELPLSAVLVTAVHRDGTLAGPDLPLVERVLDAANGMPVMAAGGISSLMHLEALDELGVSAAIVGMALHTGNLEPRVVAAEYGGGSGVPTLEFTT